MKSRFALAILVLSAAMSMAACSTVPYTGRSQLNMVSRQEEAALGRQAALQVMRTERPSRDPGMTAAVERVGRAVASVADMPGARWEFHVIENREPNAFCLPGGIIFVYSGIFRFAQNDDQLAAVIAHEVAHALARHGTERMSRQLALAIPGVVLSTVIGVQSPELAGMFSRVYGIGTQVGYALPHSREQEYEADRIGLILMARAGYDPGAAVSFWRNMRQAGGSKPPEFLSTHPASDRRMEAIIRALPEARSHMPGGDPVFIPPDDDPPPGVEG